MKSKYGVRCYCEAKNAPASVCDGKSVMKDEDKQCCKPGDDPLCCKTCVDGGADGGAPSDGGGGPSDGGLRTTPLLHDSCKGRVDGTYCSELWSFSAIVCKNESIAYGAQCPGNAKCLGPNGPGTLQCEGMAGGSSSGGPMDAGGPTGDTCNGRADGLYCSIAAPYSAYQCKGGSTAGGAYCASGHTCIGPNGPGTTIQCN